MIYTLHAEIDQKNDLLEKYRTLATYTIPAVECAIAELTEAAQSSDGNLRHQLEQRREQLQKALNAIKSDLEDPNNPEPLFKINENQET